MGQNLGPKLLRFLRVLFIVLGYAHVSANNQNLDSERGKEKEAGAGRVFADTITGAVRHRPELDHLWTMSGAGLVSSSMESPTNGWAIWLVSWGRLGRSVLELLPRAGALRQLRARQDLDTNKRRPPRSWGTAVECA